MDEAKYAKWGLLGGAVFVILTVVAAFIAGTPPKLSDNNTVIVNYFKDNRDALRIGSYLNGLGGLFFLWFLGSLFGRLRRAEGGAGRLSGVALTGAVVALATVFVAAAGKLGSNFRLSTLLFGYSAFALAVFTVSVSVVLWSQKVLPKWFGYAGEAVALLWLVGAASVATENDTIGVIGFIAFLAWAVWILLLSVMLYRKPETA